MAGPDGQVATALYSGCMQGCRSVKALTRRRKPYNIHKNKGYTHKRDQL